jgi:hypothetical protein
MKLPALLICLLIPARFALAQTQESIVLENEHFHYRISSAARNLGFVDRATGTNYLRGGDSGPCALVRAGGREYAATAANLTSNRLTLVFGDSGAQAVLRVEPRPFGVILALESLSGGEVDSLTFLNAPLTLKGLPGESFGACALSLNLSTRVDALPALQAELRASCEKKFGMIGAKAAIVAGSMSRILPLLQETLAQTSELAVCKVAGPWARETAFTHGSYLFNFGSLTESNVTDWIEMAHSVGVTQIDNHGGGEFFRFGDMELNRKKWPDGWDSWKRLVSRLHEAGIGSIFHTYAFFIDKRSKYVAPVPDLRLDAFRVFTLAEPVSAEATEIVVNESTAGMNTVTGFFEHNSVVLHMGDELATFGAVSQQAPWRFSQVKRGALGTKAAAHDRGAKARHLKECFGLFVPNPESSLFEEIAANHAEVVNRCEFDGIYLDAIDGSSILRGGDDCWYWAPKFVVEIQKRLSKPVGMEMSSMWHHFWQYRTRWQAWDYPQRGHKRFIDLHAESVNGGLLLPLHLGWWGFQSYNPPQIEPTYPDVMENLGAKLIGWDAGISLTAGVDQKALRAAPLFQRAADLLRTCEDLRHANAFDESVRSRLREPGQEFSLFTDASGKKRFRRTKSHARTLSVAEPWTLVWPTTNTFDRQPLKLRLEALISVATPVASNSTVLADLAGANAAPWKRASANGVSLILSPPTGTGNTLTELVATNAGKVPRNGAWARLDLPFDPLQNLKERQGLELEIEGDGSGALLAIRLESPRNIAYGAVADRYLPLDFIGRRTVSLVETESSRWSDFIWNDNKGAYNVYRETIEFGSVESISVWLQNLPPGRETKCQISPIRAVPLEPGRLKNPRIVAGGQSLEFPVELKSGSWIEATGPEDCVVYGPQGAPLGKVTPRGNWPVFSTGATRLEFSCERGDGPPPRARVTVFTDGEAL